MNELKNDPKNCLEKAITAQQAKVAVIGLGYVGLPIAVEQAKCGFKVTGIDLDAERVKQINCGKNYIPDVQDEELAGLVKAGRLAAVKDDQVLAEADIVVICVPTPLTATRDPDISYIEQAAEQIAGHLHPGQLITLESTTYPGTTTEVLLPKFEASGLIVGKDFFLAYSPERVDPGNAQYKTANTAKLVGGVTQNCRQLAALFYRQTISRVVPVSSTAVAEMAKVFENTYRSVNIALVNELMMLCDRMGIDVWEVVEAAATKPFGIQTFFPGPGVGGHCIPIDPYYLVWKARQYDFAARIIELSGQINLQASYYVVEKLQTALNALNKCLRGSKVLILGAAYKKDINDFRESPALKIIHLLQRAGCIVSYHDPHIPRLTLDEQENSFLMSRELTDQSLKDADCVLIITDHSSIDYTRVCRLARLVIDTRNATQGVKEGREKIQRI